MSYILLHICIYKYCICAWQKIDEIRGHEFEGELEVAYGKVWREERGQENQQSQNYTIIKENEQKNHCFKL